MNPTEMFVFLDLVMEIWKKHPHLRFGQLVVCALGVDPFYVSNEDAAKKFRNFYKTAEKIENV